MKGGYGFRGGAALAASLMLVGAGIGGQAEATVFDPGDYVPAPPGTTVFLVYGQHADAKGLYNNGQEVDPNAELSSDVLLLRYVKYVEIAGMTVDFQVVQPYVALQGKGSSAPLGKTSGLGDTFFVTTWWVHNNPSKRSYLGVTGYLWIPVVEYDRSKALNPGDNRFKGTIQLVYVKGLSEKFYLEGSLDAQFFGRNNQYIGSNTLTQKPLYQALGFVRYIPDPKNEINIRLSYATGGRTTVAGLQSNDRQENSAFLVGYRHNFTPTLQLILQAGRDIDTHSGFRERGRYQFRIAKAF